MSHVAALRIVGAVGGGCSALNVVSLLGLMKLPPGRGQVAWELLSAFTRALAAGTDW